MQTRWKESSISYWCFSKDTKAMLTRKLASHLSALRGVLGISQGEIAKIIGISRQTYIAIELLQREMAWNTYMALILFFDYISRTHYMLRQLDIFPYQLDECWLSGKMEDFEEKNES